MRMIHNSARAVAALALLVGLVLAGCSSLPFSELAVRATGMSPAGTESKPAALGMNADRLQTPVVLPEPAAVPES